MSRQLCANGRGIDVPALMSKHPVTFLSAAILAVGINFAGFWVVKVTSSLLLKVLGSVRTAFLILWGVYMYNEQVSMQSTVGYMVTLTSFAFYTKAKMSKASSSAPMKAKNSCSEAELEQMAADSRK